MLIKEANTILSLNAQICLVRVRFHNQKMTVSARAMADRKSFGQRSERVATRLQSLSLPNMISHHCTAVHCAAMSREGRLRCLYRSLSYFTVFLRCFRPGMQERIPCLSTGLGTSRHRSLDPRAAKRPLANRPAMPVRRYSH